MSQAVTPQDVEVQVKKGQALELRLAGARYRSIADTIGVSPSTAHRYVTEAMAEIRELNDGLAEDLRRIDVARCEAVIASMWIDRKKPRTADTILRALERKARLQGIDAPLKWEGSGPGGAPLAVSSGDLDLSLLSVPQLQALQDIVEAAKIIKETAAPVATIAAESVPASVETAAAEVVAIAGPIVIIPPPSTNGSHP